MNYRAWRTTWTNRMHEPHVRLFAQLDALFIDHGILRPLWNRPEKFAAEAWRSNQPSARQIKQLANRGVNTIVSLRGLSAGGATLLEIEACKQVGVDLVSFRMSSRGAPQPGVILRLAELINQIQKPVLFHCKSGADRSGFVAALYLLLTGQGSIEQAKAQLSWRYLHFKGAKTGMLYAFLCEYEAFNAQQPIDLLTWVQDYYDPDALRDSFKPRGFSSWMVDKVLRRE